MSSNRPRLRTGVWLVGLLVLSACASAPFAPTLETQPPPPTAQIVRVAYTPALQILLPEIRACAAALPGIGLAFDEIPASDLDQAGAAVGLRLGSDPERTGPVFELGSQSLAVVVHPDNPLRLLAFDQLREIYNGAATDWSLLDPAQGAGAPPAPKAITVWASLPDDDLTAAVEGLLGFPLSSTLAELHQAPDPQAVREAVAADPMAIGILPSGWVDRTLAAVDLSGIPAGEMTAPLLAYLSEEPTGLTADLLNCITHN